MEVAKQIGLNIALARKHSGLSQAKLAERLPTKASQDISRMERGVNLPRLTTLLEVARALGVPVAYLLDGIE